MFSKRIVVLIVVFLIAAALSSVQAKAAGKSPCTNLPVTVEFTSGPIGSDFSGPYVASVDLCSSPTPSYNLNMNLIGTSRSLVFNFPSFISNSSLSPDGWWTDGESFSTQPTVVLRNILFGRMNGQSTFTTRLIFQSFKGPYDNDTTKYELLFQNENVDAVAALPPNSSNTNNPYMTAKVTVQDFGGNCADASSYGHWFISVDTNTYGDGVTAARGTLSTMDFGRKSPETRLGQYDMPITFDVVATKCAPFHP